MEKRGLNSSNLSLKGPQQSRAYRIITVPMNLCSAGPRRRSGRVERTALFAATGTPLCSGMHGLPQSTTAPLLSQEFAGTQRRHTACRHSHSNPINRWMGVIRTRRHLQWPRPGPQTVIDPFTFQEQFHHK